MGAKTGAAVGAAAGSVIPGVGTALGALAGGVLGFLSPDDAPPGYDNSPIQPNSNVAAIRSRLDAMEAPGAIATEGPYQSETYTPSGTSYQAKDYSAPLPEYDAQRNQVNQTYNSQGQQQQDAIARKYASMGMSNSGSAVKTAQLADQSNLQGRTNAIQNVGFQEAQQRRQLQTNEDNKIFQSSEALAGRNFQGQEAAAGRNFQGKENVSNRNLQTNEFNKGQTNQFNQFKFGAESNLVKMDMDNQNSELDRRQKSFEAAMAGYQSKHSGGLFGGGGFLGTGLG